jgi:hypothetical protein
LTSHSISAGGLRREAHTTGTRAAQFVYPGGVQQNRVRPSTPGASTSDLSSAQHEVDFDERSSLQPKAG